MVNSLPGINPSDVDDLIQIGRIGLIKAATTFDKAKGRKFSTYAGKCINNEIYMYFRREKKHQADISLNEPINADSEDNQLELEDVLGTEEDLVEKQADESDEKKIIEDALNIILNLLEPTESITILYEISGICTQNDIAASLGISRSYVSRLAKKAKKSLKEYLEIGEKTTLCYFAMHKIGDFYKFSCCNKNLNKHLESILGNDTPAILLDYKIAGDNERIELLMPSCSETFVYLAEIMMEIYALGE